MLYFDADSKKKFFGTYIYLKFFSLLQGFVFVFIL